MPLELLLAFRYLRSSTKEKNSNRMIKICSLSIFVSSLALTLISAIMNGFEKATHTKLQGIHSDIIIQAGGKPINFKKVQTVISNEFKDLIEASSPASLSQVIVQHKSNNQDNLHSLVILKGIDLVHEFQVTSLKTMLIETDKNLEFNNLLKKNNIIIGQSLAKLLGVTIGQYIDILYADTDEITGNKICLNMQKAHISGIFKTGINEFDEHIIFSSLDFFDKIFSSGITQVNLKLKNIKFEQTVIEKLKKRFSMEVLSWKDLYPALVSALILEKYAMFFILVLVIFIAAMNLTSLLFMLITQKTGHIALLKSLSMSDNKIKKIFIYFGMFLTCLPAFTAVLIGSLISWLINKYKLIKLPDAYYVTHLPAKIDWTLIILILSSIVIISLIATFLPIQKIKDINITQVLKQELG